LSGQAKATTAEQLMRARYTAFERADVDFILKTHDPDTASQVDRRATELWAKESKWTGLEIIRTEAGGVGDNFGQVEFVASYELRGTPIQHRELATFRRQGDTWFFVDGEQIAGPPVRREGPKVGRNDPCSCGSGKKYKKCCGAAA
jgi:SEC-C motif domain protein